MQGVKLRTEHEGRVFSAIFVLSTSADIYPRSGKLQTCIIDYTLDLHVKLIRELQTNFDPTCPVMLFITWKRLLVHVKLLI